MNNIKEIFNKNNSKLQNFILYVPFIVLFFIFLFIHLRYNYHVDDVFYRQSMLRDGWVEIVGTVYRRYFTWTSRSLIELNIFFLSYVPMIVWKVLDSLILVFMAMIIPKFFLEKNNVKNNILSSILILLFFIPVYDAMNAGAIAISLNYIWPLFFIIVHFWLLKKYILKNNKLKPLATFLVYILLIFSLLFGCNHEQGLISCLIIYLTLLAYSYYSSKKN